MCRHTRFLNLAARISRIKRDSRNYFIGAVGIRADGTLVCAYNGAPPEPCPEHHCEFRLCRKLDRGAIVYVARTGAYGDWALSKPCDSCMLRLMSKKVRRVYYTISKGEYGTICTGLR